jgi:bacteriorhodopsin
MLEAWLSFGYIVLLAILVLAFILWRRGTPVLAIAALVVGIPLWFGWEYARLSWTTGVITGMEVRRSNPDARGNVTDIRYIFIRGQSDRGLELINQDSWWWLKWNSSRILNDAMVAQSRNSEVTLMWTGWRSMLFNWYPNVIAIGPAGSWPGSLRTIIFYGLSVILWLGYFYAFFRLRRSSAPLRDREPPTHPASAH